MSVVKLENGVIIPLHWNDRFYESPECAECGREEWGKTISEVKEKIEQHAC